MTKQPRPRCLESTTIELLCPCGKIYITVTFQAEKPFEVFARLGKNGGCAAAVVAGICSTMSIALRSGADLADLVKGIESISCHRNRVVIDGQGVLSCVDAIAKAAKTMIPATHQEV